MAVTILQSSTGNLELSFVLDRVMEEPPECERELVFASPVGDGSLASFYLGADGSRYVCIAGEKEVWLAGKPWLDGIRACTERIQ
jgi:hypothetical protein